MYIRYWPHLLIVVFKVGPKFFIDKEGKREIKKKSMKMLGKLTLFLSSLPSSLPSSLKMNFSRPLHRENHFQIVKHGIFSQVLIKFYWSSVSQGGQLKCPLPLCFWCKLFVACSLLGAKHRNYFKPIDVLCSPVSQEDWILLPRDEWSWENNVGRVEKEPITRSTK